MISAYSIAALMFCIKSSGEFASVFVLMDACEPERDVMPELNERVEWADKGNELCKFPDGLGT